MQVNVVRPQAEAGASLENGSVLKERGFPMAGSRWCQVIPGYRDPRTLWRPRARPGGAQGKGTQARGSPGPGRSQARGSPGPGRGPGQRL